MSELILESVLVCPVCGFAKRETMPTDSCQFFYKCNSCKTLLRPKSGDCCVFCSYGSVKCPPMQGENCSCLNSSVIHFLPESVGSPPFDFSDPTYLPVTLGSGHDTPSPGRVPCECPRHADLHTYISFSRNSRPIRTRLIGWQGKVRARTKQ